jgi:hypothetical protein
MAKGQLDICNVYLANFKGEILPVQVQILPAANTNIYERRIKMSKFKIGDRVKALDDGDGYDEGDLGTVMEEDSMPEIKWDNGEIEMEDEDRLELVEQEGKKKVKEKKYAKTTYHQFVCATNEDCSAIINPDPKYEGFDRKRKIAVYELKGFVEIETTLRVKKVK